MYDVHATILHLLGFDHTRLNVKHKGLDYRLTGGPHGDGLLETQRWHVWCIEAPDGVRDVWTHDVHGDGIDAGYRFGYRWAPLDAALVDRVHERFRPLVARLAGQPPGRIG